MNVNYKNSFSKQRIFRDITNKKKDVVNLMKSNLLDESVIKIYECKNTIIIHSKNDGKNHASISHRDGCSYIQEWEIEYAMDRILKERRENVIMLVGKGNVIHLYAKENTTVYN